MHFEVHYVCMSASRRVYVTLETRTDEAILQEFTDDYRPERATLEQWAAEHDLTLRTASEGSIVRALARAGAEALRERALEAGYTQLASEQAADPQGQAERRALRARYAARAEPHYAADNR